VILIQILAAALLLLGSALLIHALVSLDDTPARPRALPRQRFESAPGHASEERLPRAA
jgi:hypothetical protein